MIRRALWFLLPLGLAVEAGAVEPVFPIAADTTYVNGPLDAEGYVDYAEALNERYGRGVTPANNAHAALWGSLGPGPVDPEFRAAYFQRLAIDPPPEKGNDFVTFKKFMELRESDPENELNVREQLTSAAGRPWTAAEFPHVAAWLNANEKPLSIIDRAVKRPDYFRPVVVPETPQGRGGLLESPIPGISELLDIAGALAARAMLRTAEGKYADAWNDLLNCHRLGRLVARGPCLVELLVGYSIDNMAAAADIRYLASRKFTVDAAASHADDLDRLPTMPPLADKLTFAERFMYLDGVRLIQRGGLDAIQRLGGEPPKENPGLIQRYLVSADFVPALRKGNRWYDRLAAAARTNDRPARRAEFARIEKDLKSLAPKGSWQKFGFWTGLAVGSTSTRGERIGDLLTLLMLPTLSTTDQLEGHSVQQVRNVKVALALAAFRNDEGRYPARLDELVPKYLAEVPKDLFSEKPPIYRPVDDGYLLYSIGANGIDEEGRSYNADRTMPYGTDDIAIRMPTPPPADAKN